MSLLNVFSELNWVAIAVAAMASSILGGLWFTVLFSKAYAVALGRQNVPPTQLAPIFIVGPFICGVIAIVTSAIFIQALNIRSIADALIFGAVVGIGYFASTTVNIAINPNIPRPLFYGLISGSYFLLSNLIVNVILVSLK